MIDQVGDINLVTEACFELAELLSQAMSTIRRFSF